MQIEHAEPGRCQRTKRRSSLTRWSSSALNRRLVNAFARSTSVTGIATSSSLSPWRGPFGEVEPSLSRIGRGGRSEPVDLAVLLPQVTQQRRGVERPTGRARPSRRAAACRRGGRRARAGDREAAPARPPPAAASRSAARSRATLPEPRRDHVAERVRGEVAERARRPVHVLEHPVGVVGGPRSRAARRASAASLGELGGREAPSNSSTLELEAERDVEVVGDLVGLDPDQRTARPGWRPGRAARRRGRRTAAEAARASIGSS